MSHGILIKKTCNDCAFCTDKSEESYNAKCISPHNPTNAKGETGKNVLTIQRECKYFSPVRNQGPRRTARRAAVPNKTQTSRAARPWENKTEE